MQYETLDYHRTTETRLQNASLASMHTLSGADLTLGATDIYTSGESVMRGSTIGSTGDVNLHADRYCINVKGESMQNKARLP